MKRLLKWQRRLAFLLFILLAGFADYELDNSFTQKTLDIQKLNDEDKSSIIKTNDALLRDAKVRKAYAS